jgi:hypothetical protein
MWKARTVRSYEPIEEEDLRRLAAFAREDRDAFFMRHERWRPYADRVLCVALCQGAALHYVDGRNGVKDFDVYTFYAESPEAGPWWARRIARVDFGRSRFGRHPDDPPQFTGRRVDLCARSLPVSPDADPVESVRAYLREGRTETARHLALKAVVLADPEQRLGHVAWPQGGKVVGSDAWRGGTSFKPETRRSCEP